MVRTRFSRRKLKILTKIIIISYQRNADVRRRSAFDSPSVGATLFRSTFSGGHPETFKNAHKIDQGSTDKNEQFSEQKCRTKYQSQQQCRLQYENQQFLKRIETTSCHQYVAHTVDQKTQNHNRDVTQRNQGAEQIEYFGDLEIKQLQNRFHY